MLGDPNRVEMCHLLQACLHGELARTLNIQFLGKGCYHVEFISGDMVDKLFFAG